MVRKWNLSILPSSCLPTTKKPTWRANARLLAAKLAELGITFEIVIVDDASRDRTGAIADELAVADPCVRVIHHPSNLGIGGGFLTGLHAARGEWLILIPADLALELSDLGKYLEAAAVSAEGQPDVVVGIRSDRSDYSAVRLLVSWVNIRLIQVLFGMRERQFQYISMYRVAFCGGLRSSIGAARFSTLRR